MRIRAIGLIVLFTLLPVVPAYTQDERYVNIETRSGVSQGFMLIEPAKPVASVVLFAGGTGLIGVSTNGIRSGENFLVRSRHLFAMHGFLVATVDAASDRQGGLVGFRNTEKHAQDIRGVIAYVRRQANLPVWVIGTSRGTISAANSGGASWRGRP